MHSVEKELSIRISLTVPQISARLRPGTASAETFYKGTYLTYPTPLPGLVETKQGRSSRPFDDDP